MENSLKKLLKKEKKINIEGLKDRGRLILTTMLVSFYFGSGNQVEAQSNMPIASAEVEQNPIDFEKKYQAPETEVSPEVLKKIEGMYQEQKAWLLTYMQSENYLKYMLIERLHQKKLLKDRSKIEENLSLDKKIALSDIFDKYDLNSDFNNLLPPEEVEKVKTMRDERIKIVKNTLYKILKDIPGYKEDETVAGYVDVNSADSLAGYIVVDSDMALGSLDQTFFVHEFDHAVRKAFGGLVSFHKVVPEKRTIAEEDYYRKAEEILARRTAFLFMLAKEGIYDITTATEPFTVEHLNKVLENEAMNHNSDVVEYLSSLYIEDAFFFINNIAGGGVRIHLDKEGNLKGVGVGNIYHLNYMGDENSKAA